MPKIKFNRLISIAIAAAIVANASAPISANQLMPFAEKSVPPSKHLSSFVQPKSTNFSIKSIEKKILNIFNSTNKMKSKNLQILDSKSCGNGVYYKFIPDSHDSPDSGILNIYGAGEMYHYTADSPAPWDADKNLIKSVIINDGITSVGDYAFADCKKLTSVTVPSSVTFIGDHAFNGCENLISATIQNGVTFIGDGAFAKCKNLTEVSIPNSVTSIGAGAFNDAGLTQVTIPNSIIFIGEYAFAHCSGLTSAIIGNSVAFMGFGAFEYCKNLTSVTINNGVTSIGNGAFYGCTSLTKLDIPNTVTSIGRDVFVECTELSSINVGSDNKNYKSLDGVLYSKAGDTLIACPAKKEAYYDSILNNVTTIENYAFSCCSKLAFVTIPDSVTSIGSGVFYGCTGLTSINVDSGNKNYKSIDGVLYSKPGDTLIVCPAKNAIIYDNILNNVTSIGDYAFSYCSGLTQLTIPDSVTSIGMRAFCHCENLTEVSIPNGVTSIEKATFEACYTLKHLTIPDGVITIGMYAFVDCKNLTSVTIGNSVGSIGDNAFEYCTALKNVTIPDRVTSIGENAFVGCKNLTSVAIGNSVNSIGSYAFRRCTSLTSINIPDSVNKIGLGAFFECPNLTSVTLSNSYLAQNFKTIFPSYVNFKTITLGDKVKSIVDSAFADCASLKNVTVLGNLDHVGNGAFSNCIELDNFDYKGITAPRYDTGTNVFYNCPNLEKVNVPDNYEGNDFCGKITSKKNLEPSRGDKIWNVMTKYVFPSIGAAAGVCTVVGFIIKWKEIRDFCLSHCSCCSCCNRGVEDSTINDNLLEQA